MTFIKTHLPCPECGGSDPASLNDDGSMYCFSCDKLIPNHDSSISPTPVEFKTYKNNSVNTSDGSFNALTDRSISLSTAKKYGVKSILNSKDEIDTHIYPYYNVNEIGAYKLRDAKKTFFWQGSSVGTGLFGQQLFQEGGKYITITEGECDAMAGYELLGSKWPVVSLKNGAGGAVRDIKASLEFLEKFDKIVINFDSDTPGREAAKKWLGYLLRAKP